MVLDIPGQFRLLFRSYDRCIDLTTEQMLEIVESRLEGCRARGMSGHWAYEGIVHHQALADLRDALIVACSTDRRAA